MGRVEDTGMDYFEYRNGELWCEGVRVARLAREYGTPLYVYSARTIGEHFRRIREAFTRTAPCPGPESLICYSVKANSNLAVLNLLKGDGAGFDVVSGGELHRVLKIGADPKRIVFAGVGKTDAEIAAGLDAGILMFNVESEDELDNIERIAGKKKMTAPVALRLNPDVDPKTHKYITTGRHENKFGIDLVTAGEIIESWSGRRHLRLVGLHVHVGSQLLSVKPYVAALKKVVRFVKLHREALGLSSSGLGPERLPEQGGGRAARRRLRDVGSRSCLLQLRTADSELRPRDGASRGIAIEWINVGGGFGVFYREREALSAQEFADAVLPLAAKIAPRIVLEPGRFIVGNAGILLTRVLYTKDSGDKVFVVCDSGMNDLIRPSLYGAFHRVWPVRPRAAGGTGDAGGSPGCRPSGRREYLAAEYSESQIAADIVGPICESGDFLAKGIRLPRVSRGDLLAVFSAGAYGYSMASNYNSRPRAAEVLVSGRKHRLVSRRETYDDLVRRERT